MTNKHPIDAVDICSFVKTKLSMVSLSNPDDLHLFCLLGVNPVVDGSAFLEYGNVKVLCTIFGPFEMRHEGQLTTSFKYSPFCYRNRIKNTASLDEKRLGQLLLSAVESSIMLHTFPRGSYQMCVMILDDGGRESRTASPLCLPAAITCAGLALVHSGIQLYDMVVGLQVGPGLGVTSTGADLVVAVLPQLRQVSMLHCAEASTTTTSLRGLLPSCLDRGLRLHNHLRALLHQSASALGGRRGEESPAQC